MPQTVGDCPRRMPWLIRPSARIAGAAVLVASVLAASFAPGAGAAPVNVLTFHNANDRLGWNRQEKALTLNNVNSAHFGKLWEKPLDGQTYASPLYVSGVTIKGRKRDVVYTATENNSVYALDAATGAILWTASAIAPPVNDVEFTDCPMVSPLHGITSTPVIDLATNTLYACGIVQPKVKQIYKIWAMDIRTGARKPGWPVVLQGSYHGCVFEAGQLIQRGALNLVNGWVYATFGARCDQGDWHGWIVGVNTAKPAAAQRMFCATPTGDGAGIWCAGGLSADAAGNLYATTGNGDNSMETGGGDISESVFRLTSSGSSFAFSGKPKDYYLPANYKKLDDDDEDLGASGVLVLPDQPGTSTPHLVVTGGKDGLVYMLNRDNLGGVGAEVFKRRYFGSDASLREHMDILSMGCYFDGGGAGRFVYIPGNEGGPSGENGLVALRIAPANGDSSRKAALTEAWTLRRPVNSPASPVVSSDGPRNGIVWLIAPYGRWEDSGPVGSLYAFNALTGDLLYDSEQRSDRDKLQDARKFSSPVIANGRVYVATHGIVAYGLLGGVGGGSSSSASHGGKTHGRKR